MNGNISNTEYILPSHRIKILGTVIFILSLFLIYTLLTLNDKISFSDFLLIPILVISILWFRRFLSRYSKIGFVISTDGLFDLNMDLICTIDDIKKIDVSPYTFKSANGFIILLKTKSSFKSIPGLYWRVGKRISIGGLVSKNESKLLSGRLIEMFEKTSMLW